MVMRDAFMDRIMKQIEEMIEAIAKTSVPRPIPKRPIPPRAHYPTLNSVWGMPGPRHEPYGTMLKSKAGTSGMVITPTEVWCFGCKHMEPASIEGWALEET